jgi:hypothetical protein
MQVPFPWLCLPSAEQKWDLFLSWYSSLTAYSFTSPVRAYGVYAPSKRAALTQARQTLGQSPLTVSPTLDWQTYCAQQGAQHPERCPVCGQRLLRTATVPPERNTRQPVPLPQPGIPPARLPALREAA